MSPEILREIHLKMPASELFLLIDKVAGLQLFSCFPTGFMPASLLKKRLRHRCCLVNFVKFQSTAFFTEHLWWLLL